MPSPAYEAMKRDVLETVGRIPNGRYVTTSDIGRHLGIPARYVASILSRLPAESKEQLGADRVLSAKQVETTGLQPAHIEELAPMPPRSETYWDEIHRTGVTS